jgi:hypothetical protein
MDIPTEKRVWVVAIERSGAGMEAVFIVPLQA